MNSDCHAYVYKDYTEDHFGDCEHLCNFKYSELTGTNAIDVFWRMDNTIGSYTQSAAWLGGYFSMSDATLRIYLYDRGNTNLDYYLAAINTDYYVTCKRAGTAGTMKIYSDSGRTDLLDTLEITCETTTYRYLYACSSIDIGVAFTITGFSENYDLQEVPPPPEHIMTPKKYW